MIQIQPTSIGDVTVAVPGSKSYTHRMFIAAALAEGRSRIRNPLDSEDTRLTLACLVQLGAAYDEAGDDRRIDGTGGAMTAPLKPVDLANSGTSMRLLTAVAALARGTVVLTGTARMQERPVADLLDAMQQLGMRAESVNRNGCPPVRIEGGLPFGGRTQLRCKLSSQYLSALLLTAPFAEKSVEIVVTEGPVSRPYIDLTLEVMENFGIAVQRQGYDFFRIEPGQRYRAGDYTVEADHSQAGYFWAAAAITGGSVKVQGTRRRSRQGDARFVDCLSAMGCNVESKSDGIRVTGRPLKAINVDMADMPDMVPTMAVTAAFAEGTTVIENVAHLRAKESNRLEAVAAELAKMGVNAETGESSLAVTGGSPHGAEIETYKDHRIAMSFALAGLKTPGVKITGEECVKKSFPNFWEVFASVLNA
ncbi:MAG TPA: 3-phosphoshikimate 1-carboxyvinyltransferase [Desulfobacterales bacterium]